MGEESGLLLDGKLLDNGQSGHWPYEVHRGFIRASNQIFREL